MTGTPSKGRAEAHREEAESILRKSWKDGNAIGLIAAALDKAFAEGMKRAAEIAHGVGNFGDYNRDELTEDYGQPRFDMMHEIVATILAKAREAE